MNLLLILYALMTALLWIYLHAQIEQYGMLLVAAKKEWSPRQKQLLPYVHIGASLFWPATGPLLVYYHLRYQMVLVETTGENPRDP